jgi:hypothetical protein
MTTLNSLWESLRTPSRATGEHECRTRLQVTRHGTNVFAGVCGPQAQASLIVDAPEDIVRRFTQTFAGRRINVTAGPLNALGPGRWGVIIRLLDYTYEDVFAQLCECILKGVQHAQNAAQLLSSVLLQLERWKGFFERPRRGLSNEEVRGLIGELAILERLVRRLGPESAIGAWKAPAGSIRDFETATEAIEVKTYSASSGSTVWISDPLQLEQDGVRPLFLACHELVETDSEQGTLNAHVGRVAACFRDHVSLHDRYYEALAKVGFVPEQAGLYDARLALGSLLVLSVSADFPRIKQTDIPPEAGNIRYTLKLAPLQRFSVPAFETIGPKSSDAGVS